MSLNPQALSHHYKMCCTSCFLHPFGSFLYPALHPHHRHGTSICQEAIQRVRLSLYVNGLFISGDTKQARGPWRELMGVDDGLSCLERTKRWSVAMDIVISEVGLDLLHLVTSPKCGDVQRIIWEHVGKSLRKSTHFFPCKHIFFSGMTCAPNPRAQFVEGLRAFFALHRGRTPQGKRSCEGTLLCGYRLPLKRPRSAAKANFYRITNLTSGYRSVQDSTRNSLSSCRMK